MSFWSILWRFVAGERPRPRLPPITEVPEEQCAAAVFIDGPNVANGGFNQFGRRYLIDKKALATHIASHVGKRHLIIAANYERLAHDTDQTKRWVESATTAWAELGYRFFASDPGKKDIDSFIGVDMLHAAAEARAKGFTCMRFILVSGDGVYVRAFTSLMKAHPELRSELVVLAWESSMNLQLIRTAVKHGSTHLLEEYPDIVRGIARKKEHVD